MTDDVRAILERPFLKEDIDQNYSKQDYVKPHLVIRRLNEAFTQDGWRFELLERLVDTESVTQFGRLGYKDDDGEMIWKYNCGGMDRKYKTGKPHVLENQINCVTDFKGAFSNCLKRCAMLLGVALDLYGDPEYGADSSPDAPEQPPTRSGDERRKQGMSDDDKAKFDKLKARLDVAQKEAEDRGVTDEEMDALADKLIGAGKSGIAKYNAMKAYGVALSALPEGQGGGQDEPGGLPEDL